MASHQDFLGFIDTRSKAGRASVIGMKLFHQRAMRAGNILPRDPLR